MASRPRLKLNGSSLDVVGQTEIQRNDTTGATHLQGRGTFRKLRKKAISACRANVIEGLESLLSNLEISRQKDEREVLVAEIRALTEGVLRRALEKPRASGTSQLFSPSPLQSEIHTSERINTFTLGDHKATFQKESSANKEAGQRSSSSLATLLEPDKETDQSPRTSSVYEKILEIAPEIENEQNTSFLTPACAEKLRQFHPEIVLYAPQIPPNTGTIARLCAAMSARLHLIEPLGFKITDKAVRRAGLDYWDSVDLTIHKSWEHFVQMRPNRRYVFVETGTTLTPGEFAFAPGDLLILGSETIGIPQDIINDTFKNGTGVCITVPMFSRAVRSLNLANTASIVLYEALKQLHGK